MEVVSNAVPPQQLQPSPQQLILSDPPADESEIKTPKKRAETWVQDEIKALIALRKEMDTLFNTSKSNKHLWEQISTKMKERGYERSATMCTDKWRNLLKEYKKAKHQDRGGSAKVACYKDLEELLGDRAKAQIPLKSPPPLNKLEPIASPGKVPIRAALNLERRLDHDGHPAAIPSTDGMVHTSMVVANGITPPQQYWRDANANGGERRPAAPAGGKVIVVKCGDVVRRVRIDGPFESIKESLKTAFGLRSKRAFWLEDEEGVVQTLSRDMPPGEYTLNLDPGITVKICVYDTSDRLTGSTESKTLYTEEEFREFLTRRGWSGLREVGGFRDIDSLEELRTGAVYQRAGVIGA
ncbi:hypothetical protein Mapa_012038 [Marchantia paleacea]|nr:hypothetical protein Mapa_012038 [Marchantia paleacea]